MGLRLRKFLQLIKNPFVGLINPLRAVSIQGDAYSNKKLGIYFEKPAGWEFVGVKEFGNIRDAQILENGWEDKKEEVWEELGDPICLATKYDQDLPENHGVFSPTVTLHVTHRSELGDVEFDSFEELIELTACGTAHLLKDFRIVKRYPIFFQSGCQFYEHDVEYLFEHIDLPKPIPAEIKVIKIEHNNLYYDFNCHQCKFQGEVAEREIEKLKKSIKLF